MQIKVFGYAVEFGKPSFGKATEAFNTIDVSDAVCKLILPVINAQMFRVAHINQTAVTTSVIGINHAFQGNFAQYNRLKRLFFAVWNDFGINPAVPFKNTEDGLLEHSSTTF